MESIHLLNVRIDNLSSQELLENLTHGVLVTPNIDDIMKHQHDKEFHEYASQAEFSICDSKVVKLMSSIAGEPLKEAIPGSSFFPMYCDYHAKDENVKVFLLGAKEGVADVAKEKLTNVLDETLLLELILLLLVLKRMRRNASILWICLVNRLLMWF